MKREIRILNRIFSWGGDGITYEPDPRHAELIVRELGLDGAKGVATPVVTESTEGAAERALEEELDGGEATRFRSLCARINYLALDRADLQYAAKNVSRHMSRPVGSDWATLKRIGRYLVRHPRCVLHFYWQDLPTEVVGFADSDWAGEKPGRKSTSGGLLMHGGHTLKSWSSTQHCIALSSGEAELYALTKAAAQVKGLMSLIGDFGQHLQGRVCTDATAAIGMAWRRGLGKTRHIDVQYLWLQDELNEERLGLSKVNTKDNPADIFTKAVSADLLMQHLVSLGYELCDGRATTAPRLQRVHEHRNNWDACGWRRGWRDVFPQLPPRQGTPSVIYSGF